MQRYSRCSNMCLSQHIELYVIMFMCEISGLLCVPSTPIMALSAAVNLKDVSWTKFLVQ